jgi:hypothetical protein
LGACKKQDGTNRCPKNTDSNCNIIKPKPHLKRVKAWAAHYTDRAFRKKIVCSTIKFVRINGTPVKPFPCFILMDPKYLKEGK